MKEKAAALKHSLTPAPRHAPLPVDKLRWHIDPKKLKVKLSSELTPSRDIVGQERALRSLRVGLEMKHFGYNIFLTGLSGTGRTTTIKRMLQRFESTQAELSDICYVFNFKNPDMPRALRFSAGDGKEFKEEMDTFIEELFRNIPAMFESQRYQTARKSLAEHFGERQKSVLTEFEKKVEQNGFSLIQVQVGSIVRPDIVPVVDNKPVSVEQLDLLVQKGEFPREKYEAMRSNYASLEKQMATVFRELQNIERKIQDSLRDLDMRMVTPLIDGGIENLKTQFPDEKIGRHLSDIRDFLLEHLDHFKKSSEPGEKQDAKADDGVRRKLEVNLIVDNSGSKTVPIVVETDPKHKNIFGTIERQLEQGGVWRADFTHIKAGSLLRANGGYLVLNALDALVEPGVWQDLKRTLRTGKMEIQSYEPMFGFSASGMKPEPIELDLKVIMIGDAEIYRLLYFRDEDFKKIFKIRADFDFEMPRNGGAVGEYLRFIAMICQDEGLLPFDAPAMAKIVEFGVRLAGRQKKISTRFNIITDVILESNYWAAKENASAVSAKHVAKAIDERTYRVKLVEDKIQEMIVDGSIMIDTRGAVVGQVNGLSVYDVGEHAFGRPSRITARTALGRTGIINIEREAALSGPTHNKGVAIIGGFLQSRFAQNKPLVVNASITFEQSYGGVDGDSASSTEIYAILSSLSGLPLRQDIAVTGSVNQMGELQPIGGVNLKIEGFFDVCRAYGLTGKQGVLIPEQNIGDLMLREDVVDAVTQKKFHVFAARTIDEGIEILTGIEAGKDRRDGSFPSGTVNALADEKLTRFSLAWREFESRPR
ncbi:MAG TPA: ATP-binding protein [Bacteroidota bacterium]|nr:ATP-binding protein [Bacteroidota bacterium]